MATDPDYLEHALWVSLLCYCEECDEVLDTSDFDHVMDIDTLKWSAHVAVSAKAAGWSSPDGWKLLCSSCSETQP